MNISGINLGQAVRFETGMIVNCPRNTYLNGVEVVGQVFVAEDDELKTKHTTQGEVTHYKFNEERISVDKYKQLRDSLDEKYSDYVDDDGEYYFPSNEIHGYYLLDSADVFKWKLVRAEPIVEYKEFNPEVIGWVVDTKSDFINQSIRYGTVKHDGKGVFKVERSQIALDEVCQHRTLDLEVDIPNHSNIEFAKVNGGYVFTGSNKPFVKTGTNCYYTDDLQDALNQEFEVRDYVRKMIAIKTDTRPFSMANGYSKLEFILNKLRQMDVKKKSEPEWRYVIKSVRELMDKLEDEQEDK